MKNKYLLIVLTFLFAGVVYPQDNNPGKGLSFISEEKFDSLPTANSPFRGPGSEFPNYFDLSDLLPPVGYQGIQGSCVAWATAYALRSYQERVKSGIPFTKSERENEKRLFSPAYIYNQINNGVDAGGYFNDALDVLQKQGCATLETMPYLAPDYKTQPDEKAKQEAANYKITYWKKIERDEIKGLQEIKSQVSSGYPVLIGAKIDESFERLGWSQDKNTPLIWDSFDGSKTSGHAMVVVGYSDEIKAFKILNSWRDTWGNYGFIWISYDFFPKCIMEAYVAKTDTKNFPVAVNNEDANINIYYKGISALKNDEYSEAIKLLTEYISKNDKKDSAYYYLGSAYYKLHDNDNAIKYFGKAIQMNGNYTDAYKDRGTVYYILEDYNNSINDFDKVLSAENRNAEGYFYRALAHKKKKEYELALQDLSKSLETTSDNPNIFYQRGLIYGESGKWRNAVTDFENAIKLNPKVSMFYMKKGFANYKAGNYAEATANYIEALKINPDNFDANKEIGISFYKERKFELAVKYLSEAVRLDNTDFFVLFVRGSSYYDKGSFSDAVKDWDSAVKLNPEVKSYIGEKYDIAKSKMKK